MILQKIGKHYVVESEVSHFQWDTAIVQGKYEVRYGVFIKSKPVVAFSISKEEMEEYCKTYHTTIKREDHSTVI